jgi:hypothetical protein
VELIEPRKALDQAGAETRVVSPKGERARGWDFTDWGDELPVDVPLDGAKPDDFDDDIPAFNRAFPCFSGRFQKSSTLNTASTKGDRTWLRSHCSFD